MTISPEPLLVEFPGTDPVSGDLCLLWLSWRQTPSAMPHLKVSWRSKHPTFPRPHRSSPAWAFPSPAKTPFITQ